MPLDFSKPLRTVGTKNRVVYLGHFSKRHHWAEEVDPDTSFSGDRWLVDCVIEDCVQDYLENVPETMSGWLNIYPLTLHKDRDLADGYASPDRVACLKVEYEAGQGL